MPCDRTLKPNQTIQQRATEVRQAVTTLDAALAARRVQLKIGPQGAVAFIGWDAKDRDGITDACAYRRLMVTGSALARAQIAQAEQLAGRTIDRRVIGHGTHSHDGGTTWHDHK